VKILLDEHYANEIAAQLRADGHEAITVSERNLKGMDDEPLLALASSEERALLTNNARDFLPIVARWATSGQDHCGLLLTSDSSMPRGKDNIGLYVGTLSGLMQANPGARALENQVRWLTP
jgi:predicted nuclease of predicted toxin-antitoxin system